jgi:hypothetical protein
VVGKEIEFLQSNSEGGKGLHELHRSHLALVILHLHQNDYVAADKAYNQALSYARTPPHPTKDRPAFPSPPLTRGHCVDGWVGG